MITKIYALFDEQTQTFNNPFLSLYDGDATRSCTIAMKDSMSLLHQSPHDFTLYNIASYNDANGQYENVIPPRLVCRISALLKFQTITED